MNLSKRLERYEYGVALIRYQGGEERVSIVRGIEGRYIVVLRGEGIPDQGTMYGVCDDLMEAVSVMRNRHKGLKEGQLIYSNYRETRDAACCLSDWDEDSSEGWFNIAYARLGVSLESCPA